MIASNLTYEEICKLLQKADSMSSTDFFPGFAAAVEREACGVEDGDKRYQEPKRVARDRFVVWVNMFLTENLSPELPKLTPGDVFMHRLPWLEAWAVATVVRSVQNYEAGIAPA